MSLRFAHEPPAQPQRHLETWPSQFLRGLRLTAWPRAACRGFRRLSFFAIFENVFLIMQCALSRCPLYRQVSISHCFTSFEISRNHAFFRRPRFQLRPSRLHFFRGLSSVGSDERLHFRSSPDGCSFLSYAAESHRPLRSFPAIE